MAAPALQIEATPTGNLVLPPEGGTVRLSMALSNLSTATRQVQAWVSIVRLGEVGLRRRGPFDFDLAPGGSADRNASLRIPASAPPGTYVVQVAGGRFPRAAVTDTFTFEKQGAP